MNNVVTCGDGGGKGSTGLWGKFGFFNFEQIQLKTTVHELSG